MSVNIKSGAGGTLLRVDAASEAARTTLYDAAGNVIDVVQLGSKFYIANSLLQNVNVSTTNSSTTNLASAATFTGTSETSLGIAAIQINFFATQQCTVQLQQAQEVPGTNWDTVDSFIILASVGEARTFQATGSSFRVLATNNGGSTTTSLRLQTVMCPIVEALPRALTQLGNLKVAIAEANVNKASYSATVSNLTPPATPTDMVVLTGSSTRTIRVVLVEFSATQTTAGINNFFLVKRSTADSGGTSSALTIVPHDSSNIAATATILSYTANPTLGTSLGNLRGTKVCTPAPASLQSTVHLWDLDRLNTQVIVLRGTSQQLALNFAGVALPAGLSITATFTWTEEL